MSTQTTVTFVEQAGNTAVTLRTIFETQADYERAVNVFHASEGGKQTLERLAVYFSDLV
jgi:hypothetical protein